jgi:hypothetical protein
MDAHLADLILQHAAAEDLDEVTFSAIAGVFHAAQRACNFDRVEEAIEIYSLIPISAVSSRLLR